MCGHPEHHGHECECGGRGHHRGGHAWEEGCGCGYGHERGHAGGGCCCGGHDEHGAHHGHRGRCGCCEGRPLGFRRRFVSRAERIAALEAYLAELRAEVAAVEEHLTDLKKTA